MTPRPIALALSHALAGVCLVAVGNAALAQTVPPRPHGGEREARSLDAVVVQADIAYRNRSAATAPTLVYDLEYFQRFEPLTVGDMLKRVPSVVFVSDVLEYDGARLRGLDPGYTQVLVNGRKVPGAGDDRSFFVDRIPAELVERIEVVRSPSANRSGDAIAGALNIVLRDAWQFEGAYLRAGGLRFDDGTWKGSYGAVASGEVGQGHLLGGVNVQGRYNPKDKRSLRYDAPGGEFENREDQSDVRDGTDTSANLSWEHPVGDGELSLAGFWVDTDRTETEHSEEYNVLTGRSRDNLLAVNDQFEQIDQTSYSVSGSLELPGFGGDNEIALDLADLDERSVITEIETGYDDEQSPPGFDALEGVREFRSVQDYERGLHFAHTRALGSASVLEVGVEWRDKRREVTLDASEVETDEGGAPLPPFVEFERRASRIEEQRLDPYLMLSGSRGRLRWETGLRYETTDVDVGIPGEARVSSDHDLLLPSAHLRWDLDDATRLTASLARSVRRPNFNFLLPLRLEGEFGDNDFEGNPLLEPETATGIDLGVEHRIGRQGVVGINLFWRDVRDLIELVNTGEPSDEALGDHEDDVEEFLEENPGATPDVPGYPVFDPDSFVYSAANVGDGTVYGIEFDASVPLAALGLPDTGVFANYSWLDSRVRDALGERRFNDQARHVYNVGFIHDLREAGMSFGLSYRRQGDAFSRVLAEEVATRYGADLEAFIEKRFGARFALRLTGSNLLDASKDEIFDKFDTLADQIERDHDEYELETETAGPVYQLVARYSF